MKKSRFTEEQITFALRQTGSGAPVANVPWAPGRRPTIGQKKPAEAGLGTNGRSAPKRWRERHVPPRKSQGERERDNAGGYFVT